MLQKRGLPLIAYSHYCCRMNKTILSIASVLGAIAVVLGAFGAHALKQFLTPEAMAIFETGIRYQFYHVFALFIAAMVMDRADNPIAIRRASVCFVTGIVLFSGSLYLLAVLKAKEVIGLGAVGILTPIGGLFFIAGWLLLVAGFMGKK